MSGAVPEPHAGPDRRDSRSGVAAVLPGAAWIVFFLVIPSLLIALAGFARRTPLGEVEWTFTLENYRRLAGFGILGWSADYLKILLRTLAVAGFTTLLCAALAYPLAFYMAARPARQRHAWIALVIIPAFTNLVIRTYGWMMIFSAGSPLPRWLQAAGVLDEGRGLYPGMFAVQIGMVGSLLPFTVLPLYASVERMDRSLVEAAADLHAGRWRVFRHAILPQTLPGLRAALILTFIPAMGIFLVPDLLGGAKTMLAGNLIQQQFGPSRDQPFGAAAGTMFMALTLAGIFLLARGRGGRGAEP